MACFKDKPAWLDQIGQPQPSMKIPDSGMGRPLLPGFSDKYGWQIKTIDISRSINADTRFCITITLPLLLIKKGQEQYMTSEVIALSLYRKKTLPAIYYLQGNTQGDNFLMHYLQEGSPMIRHQYPIWTGRRGR